MAKENEARLGDFVTTNKHGHRGRVYMIHHNFGETGESMDWFRAQVRALEESMLKERWISILCHEGGAVLVPESEVVLTAPFEFDNPWAGTYFRA